MLCSNNFNLDIDEISELKKYIDIVRLSDIYIYQYIDEIKYISSR